MNPVSIVYGQQGVTYDFEIKTVRPGENLNFNLITGQNEVNNLPNNTPIEFTLLKRNPAGTSNNPFLGLAGVQGQWDLQNIHLEFHEKYFGQVGDSTLTNDKMLEKQLAMHAALGVKWIGMEYTWIQANQNQQINFYYLDKIFTVAKKYNLKILPMLDETPRWATSLTCNEDQSDGYPTCAMATKCIPKDLTDNGSESFNNFVKQVVERYKPHGKYFQNTGENDNGYGITHWVIWNEPNHNFGNFWTDCKKATTIYKNSQGQDVNQYDVGYRPVGSIQDYAKLFKGGYTTIKLADPSAKILMAGIAGIGPTDQHKKIESYQKFYAELTRIKSPKPDIWNAHVYMAFVNHFFWDLGLIVNERNLLDPTKEIWVTEYGFYRDFTAGNLRQQNTISELFSQTNQLNSWKVTNLFYWTAKGYIMCDYNTPGCIPYKNSSNGIASCGFFPYLGCSVAGDVVGKPYGSVEMGTLLMSPNFYPDPVYLMYGEKMGTVSQVGSNIRTTVTNNQITVNIPGSNFQLNNEYILIMSSPTKIVTTKPWIVRVSNSSPSPTPLPTATRTPTPHPTSTPRPTSTVTPGGPTFTPTPTGGAGNCPLRGDAPTPFCDGKVNSADFTRWVIEFQRGCTVADSRACADLSPAGVHADFDNSRTVDLSDYNIWFNIVKGP